MEKLQLTEVRGFIVADIEREIQLAKLSDAQGKELEKLGVNRGGGNFLAALGLLCYTEFAGKLKYNCKRNGDDFASENFNKFFDEIGTEYKNFRISGVNVYGIFRCGMAHEYLTKKNCVICMNGNCLECPTSNCPIPQEERKNISIGIGKYDNDKYYFRVEQYYHDFINAFNAYLATLP